MVESNETISQVITAWGKHRNINIYKLYSCMWGSLALVFSNESLFGFPRRKTNKEREKQLLVVAGKTEHSGIVEQFYPYQS